MTTKTRLIATIATFATVALLFAMPGAKAETAEADAAKIEERVSADRFSAPALIQTTALDAAQIEHFAQGGRAPRADRLRVSANDCRAVTWPAIPLRCLVSDDGVARSEPARTITVETRIGPNTSELTRMPATFAQR